MARSGNNEGFRMLEEFVCEAIPAPGVASAAPRGGGRNEGIVFLGETVYRCPPLAPRRDGRLAARAVFIAGASAAGSLLGGWAGAFAAALVSSALVIRPSATVR